MRAFRQLQFRLHLALERLSAVFALLAILLAMGACACYYAAAILPARLERQQRALAMAEDALSQTTTTVNRDAQPQARAEHAFYDRLGNAANLEEAIGSLLDLAAARGLPLPHVDYKWATVAEASVSGYQISFTIQGSYPAVRQLCHDYLAAVPYAAMEEFSLKRETTNSAQIQAKVRFTLYLDNNRAALGAPRLASQQAREP